MRSPLETVKKIDLFVREDGIMESIVGRDEFLLDDLHIGNRGGSFHGSTKRLLLFV